MSTLTILRNMCCEKAKTVEAGALKVWLHARWANATGITPDHLIARRTSATGTKTNSGIPENNSRRCKVEMYL
jgi:hypothetical protein